MPVFFQQTIDESTKLAIWKIEEEESFFHVPLQRSITHPHKRLQHLAGRYLLRFLFPDFPLELIKIADTNKPFLEDEAYHFSVSHCGDFAAALVSKNKRVGIDIEVPNGKVERIKEKFLHGDELQMLNNSPAASPDAALMQVTLLWSCKEAVFKWWSFGKVDFSEMIRVRNPNHNKIVDAEFLHNNAAVPLSIHTRVFKELSLAWVATVMESRKS